MKKLKVLASTILLMLANTAEVSASSNADASNAGFRFNFSNPGAPNLGVAGAFTAKADDASAALVNPAGLTQVDSSVIAEYRHFGYDTRLVVGGDITYKFPGLNANAIVVEDRPEYATTSSTTNALSYLAATGTWSGLHFSGFYSTLADFGLDFRFRGTEFVDDEFPELALNILPPADTRSRFELDTLGLALAGRVGNLSIGGSVQRQRLDLFSQTITDPIALFDNARDINTQRGVDSSFTWAAGVLWRNADNRWGVGANWRAGADFRVNLESRRVADGTQPQDNPLSIDKSYPLRMPHQLSLGWYWKPSVDSGLTVTTDAVWVDYSRLSVVVDAFLDDPPQGTRLPVAEDGWEYRLGVEYRLADRPLFLRAGVWREPDSSLFFKGDQIAGYTQTDENGNFLLGNFEIFDRFLFRKRGDVWHGAVGLGYVFERVSIDLAADFSKPVDVYALSVNWLFGE